MNFGIDKLDLSVTNKIDSKYDHLLKDIGILNNKLIIMCLLSKIMYYYNNISYINEKIKPLNIPYYINNSFDNNVVYGIFIINNYIVVSFKGTSTFKEKINDVQFIQVDDKYNIPGKIHKGFNDSVLNNDVVRIIDYNLKKIIFKKDSYIKHKLYITGHSLGGALATIFYSFMKNKVENDFDIELITFGCPKVGNKEFVNFINKSNKNDKCLRIINGNDIITKLPISCCYKHHEKPIKIGNVSSLNIIKDHSIDNYLKNLGN